MLTIGFAIMLLAATAFVALPLWRHRRRQTASDGAVRHGVMQDLYRQRVEEVQREVGDAALVEELERELGQVLLVEAKGLKRDESADSAVAGGRHWSGLAVLASLPILALLVYFTAADPGLERVRGAEAVLTLPAEEADALKDWRARLVARVGDAPEDHKSLYLLAHAALKLGDYAAAADAFGRTNALTPDDPTVQIYWLQARYLAAAGVLDDGGRALAEEILAANPNIPVVLEILALDAVRQGDAPEAVRLLNRAITGTPSVAQQTAFAGAIRELRKNFTLPGVTVQISAEGAVPATSAATVFVVARPRGGGMPYAVVKRPAMLLPTEVRLDDLVAMSESRTLSDAEDIEIVVRLSASGQAMAAPGDWQWQTPAEISAGNRAYNAILRAPQQGISGGQNQGPEAALAPVVPGGGTPLADASP